MVSTKDFLAGMLFLAIGAVGLIVGWNYETGTLSQAGAGLAPKVLCLGLIGLGAVIALRSVRAGPLARSGPSTQFADSDPSGESAPFASLAPLTPLAPVGQSAPPAPPRHVASPLPWRPLVAVLGALLLFALLIDRLGLVLTVAAMVGFMYFVSGQRRWIEAAVVGLVAGSACTALFVFGLKLSFKAGWW